MKNHYYDLRKDQWLPMSDHFQNWHSATADLPWGVQTVMFDTLQAVADGQVRLVHGADYKDGSPCLVNAVANMTEAGGGKGVPSSKFSNLVGAFDHINRFLQGEGVNEDDGFVSPLAAEILLRNFGQLKNKPVAAAVSEAVAPVAFETGVYKEPSDEELTRDWLNALSEDHVCPPEPTESVNADRVTG